MKTVFTSHEIAHVWANKSAPHGKSPGAVSFNGPVILSYATAIARHVEYKGKAAVILNETKYSVTTSGHQNMISSAIPEEVPIFRVSGLGRGEDLRFTGEELFEHYIQQAQQAEEDSRQPRIRPHTVETHKARAASFLEQAREVAAFYGLRRKVDEKAIQRLATAKARAEKREAIARAKREEAERAQMQAAYEDWKQGKDEDYFNARLFPHAFRIEGEELVSTLGARIPIEDARKAVRFVLAKRKAWNHVPKCSRCGCDALACLAHNNEEVISQWRNRGIEIWHGERFPVGMYQLDAVNAQGVVAGCHRVTWEEVERVEAMLASVQTVNA